MVTAAVKRAGVRRRVRKLEAELRRALKGFDAARRDLARLAALRKRLDDCARGERRSGAGAKKSSDFDGLRRSAMRGALSAQFKLGRRYMQGIGVHVNRRQGFKWLMRAAMAGHVKAASHVGILLRIGHGVCQNEALGRRWLSRAARKGDRLAGEMLRIG